jgi:hypothetical protein
VVGGPHFDNLLHRPDGGGFQSLSGRQLQHHSSCRNGINHGVRGSGVDYHHGGKWENGDGGGRGSYNSPFDARAAKFALECKRRGMRTGHKDLRDLLTGCTLPQVGVSGVAPRNEGGGRVGGGGAGAWRCHWPPTAAVHPDQGRLRGGLVPPPPLPGAGEGGPWR